MSESYCQSCGMPMTDELYGREKDGSISKEYCRYCISEGTFTADVTMEEMIEFCVPHMTAGNPGMSSTEAGALLRTSFPTLKRWKSSKS